MTGEPVIVASPWTPELIAALFVGITTLIGAVTTTIVTVIKTRKEVREVHAFVNGSNTVLLEHIVRLTSRIATLTGESADAEEAYRAENAARGKRETVADVADGNWPKGKERRRP